MFKASKHIHSVPVYVRITQQASERERERMKRAHAHARKQSHYCNEKRKKQMVMGSLIWNVYEYALYTNVCWMHVTLTVSFSSGIGFVGRVLEENTTLAAAVVVIEIARVSATVMVVAKLTQVSGIFVAKQTHLKLRYILLLRHTECHFSTSNV